MSQPGRLLAVSLLEDLAQKLGPSASPDPIGQRLAQPEGDPLCLFFSAPIYTSWTAAVRPVLIDTPRCHDDSIAHHGGHYLDSVGRCVIVLWED